MKRLATLALTLVALACSASPSKAQNPVPGGWSNQVRYQGVGAGYSFTPSYGQLGWGSNWYGPNAYNSGVVTTRNRQVRTYTARPQTVNNLGFLGETVRRSVRPGRSR